MIKNKLNKYIQKRKGDIFQILIVLIIIFVLALIGFLTLTVSTRVNQFWDSSGLLNSTEVGTNAIDTIQDTAPRTTDYAILFAFLGMNIGVVIAAVRTRFSPTTIILFIFLTLISIMISAGMVNMYQGLAQTPSVSDIGEGLNFTNFLFSKYLPLIITILSALVMLIMYGKQGGDIIS